MVENYKSSNRHITYIKEILKTIFPSDRLILEPQKAAIYGTDASRLFEVPLGVVFPNTNEEVQRLFKLANSFKTPIIPRGRGTNVVGDCVPLKNSIVISTLWMDNIIDIDDKNFIAVVQPGVVTGKLQEEVKSKGLFYPPDPSSASFSTIGGNIATNAGGLRAVKYGVTKDYVLGLEVVLPTGEIINTGGRFHKNSVGLDLTKLFVGSEGTLGFITKAILKLLPLPESSASILAGFEDISMGFSCLWELFKRAILPVAVEFLDEKISSLFFNDKNIKMSLIIKVDGNTDSVRKDLIKIKDVFKKASVMKIGTTKEQEDRIWDIRRTLNQISFKFGKDKLGMDITVPRGNLEKIIGFIKEEERESGLPILVFGHLGDGNLHVNIMYNKEKEREKKLAEEVSEKIYLFCLNLKGTISGEHGIGIVKLNLLKHQLSPIEIELMRKIKQIFDPNNIMNPGKAY